MTRDIQRFLKKLKALNRKWTFDGYNYRMIRLADTNESTCPISAAANVTGLQWTKYYKFLKLSHRSANMIAKAADSPYAYPELRAALLEACGLKEVE